MFLYQLSIYHYIYEIHIVNFDKDHQNIVFSRINFVSN